MSRVECHFVQSFGSHPKECGKVYPEVGKVPEEGGGDEAGKVHSDVPEYHLFSFSLSLPPSILSGIIPNNKKEEL